MKKKKLSQWILLLGFVLGICLPLPLWLVQGAGKETENSEMRTMAGLPTLTKENYSSYPSEFESWFNDHMPLREELIAGNAAADYLFFHSSSDKVIVGEEDWLFYGTNADGDPVADYQGTNLYPEPALSSMADKCEKLRVELEGKGIRFVLFLAPNKERVYSEYMPQQYGEAAQECRLRQLEAYLREHTQVEVVSCLDAVMEAKEQTQLPLWYKTDTHWNDLGAYVGSRELLGALGIELPALTSDRYSLKKGEDTTGDLARLLHLSFLFRGKDSEYILEGFERKGEDVSGEGYHATVDHYTGGGDPRRLYVCRDSYCDAMLPYIGSCFSESRFCYRQFFSKEEMLAYQPDIVVYEVVERYLNELMFLE